MSAIGDFALLPETVVLRIFHHTNIREILRCQRLSKHFDHLVRNNVDRIQPLRISDTEVHISLPHSLGGSFTFRPTKSSVVHSLHYLMNQRFEIDKESEGAAPLPRPPSLKRDHRFFIRGSWHVIMEGGEELDINPFPFIFDVLKLLADSFEFVDLEISANGEESFKTFHLTKLFPKIRRLVLDNVSLDPEANIDEMLSLPSLSSLTILRDFNHLTPLLLQSALIARLSVLHFNLADNEQLQRFDDNMLLALSNLRNLRIRENGRTGATSVTCAGLWKLQQAWKRSERQIHQIELGLQGDFATEAGAVIHKQHQCRRCGERRDRLTTGERHTLLRDNTNEQLQLVVEPCLPTMFAVKFRLYDYWDEDCWLEREATIIGDFELLPESCRLRIFHFLSVGDVFRCRRLSIYYAKFLLDNFNRIQPQRIADREAHITLPLEFAATFILSHSEDTSFKRVHFIIDDWMSERDREASVHTPCIRNCRIKSNGNWHALNPVNRLDTQRSFVDDVFTFFSLVFSSRVVTIRGQNSEKLHVLWQFYFPQVSRLVLGDPLEEFEVDMHMVGSFYNKKLLEKSELSELVVEHAAILNLEHLFQSPLAAKLLKLRLDVVDNSLLLFNDEALLISFPSLQYLDLKRNRKQCATGITPAGVEKLETAWRRGEREIREMDFGVQGNYHADGDSLFGKKAENPLDASPEDQEAVKKARLEKVRHLLLQGAAKLSMAITFYSTEFFGVTYKLEETVPGLVANGSI